jgi:glyoxylase-like metal-dependent hydrolase (beta-lactamase superfamily II)
MSNVILKLSQTNCYLLNAGSGYVLIDCGNEWDKNALISSLKRTEQDLSKINFLVLTHHHSDHCGLLNYIKNINPGLRAVMSRKCAELLKTGSHYKSENEVYANTGLRIAMSAYFKLLNKSHGDFPPYPGHTDDIILDGDWEPDPSELGINLKFIMTPGHTPDSISVVFGNSAFAGDAARGTLNFTGAKYLPIIYSDLDACHKSWEKLINAGAKTIYPSHGNPFKAEKLIIH